MHIDCIVTSYLGIPTLGNPVAATCICTHVTIILTVTASEHLFTLVYFSFQTMYISVLNTTTPHFLFNP
jgi:hypothetical protein